MNMNTDVLLMNWNMNSNEPVKVRGFRHKFAVREFECGLLYRHGKFQVRLEAGRHVRWGFGYALTTVDLRKQTFPVAGQEVLSGDNVGLKVSVAVTVQVADPLKAMHEVQDWRGHLYSTVQIALRALVAAQPVEALLVQRLDVGKQLLAAVQPEAGKIGIAVQAVEVKDVMFPGDLKKAFAEVLKAKRRVAQPCECCAIVGKQSGVAKLALDPVDQCRRQHAGDGFADGLCPAECG
jgi:regulator of protease activity HflC (stomatin/prohibitin superfamily)